MRFIIDRKKIVSNIAHLTTIIPIKTTMPILLSILIDADSEKNRVRFTTSDLHLTAIAEFDAEVIVSGQVAVSAKNLNDIVSTLDDAPVLFEKIEDMLDIKCKKAKFDLFCSDHNQFPLVPDFDMEDAIHLDAFTVKKMINNSHFATSTDSSKPILKGINWKIFPDKQIMATMDGRRAAENICNHTIELQEEIDNIFEQKTMLFLEKQLTELREPLKFMMLEGRVLLGYKNLKMVARLVEGKYPNYSKILIDKNTNKLIINKNLIKNAIRRVSSLSTEDYLSVMLELADNKLFIYSANTELGEAKETIEDFNYSGDPMKAAYNYRFIAQVLSVIEADEVEISFAPVENGYSNGQTFLYNYPKLNNCQATYLLMPLRFR